MAAKADPTAAGAPAGSGVALLQELSNLNYAIVAGAGAATPIAVAGVTIAKTVLIAAFVVKDPGATTTASIVDLQAGMSLPSDGNVQFAAATNVAAGDRVIVIWRQKP